MGVGSEAEIGKGKEKGSIRSANTHRAYSLAGDTAVSKACRPCPQTLCRLAHRQQINKVGVGQDRAHPACTCAGLSSRRPACQEPAGVPAQQVPGEGPEYQPEGCTQPWKPPLTTRASPSPLMMVRTEKQAGPLCKEPPQCLSSIFPDASSQ